MAALRSYVLGPFVFGSCSVSRQAFLCPHKMFVRLDRAKALRCGWQTPLITLSFQHGTQKRCQKVDNPFREEGDAT